LKEFVVKEFSLNYKDPDTGTSQRKQLEQVWKATGNIPPELELPDLPEEILYLREIFWDLWDSEGWSWNELQSYQEIFGIELNGFEIETVRSIFGACSEWLSNKMKPKKSRAPKNPPKRGR